MSELARENWRGIFLALGWRWRRRTSVPLRERKHGLAWARDRVLNQGPVNVARGSWELLSSGLAAGDTTLWAGIVSANLASGLFFEDLCAFAVTDPEPEAIARSLRERVIERLEQLERGFRATRNEWIRWQVVRVCEIAGDVAPAWITDGAPPEDSCHWHNLLELQVQRLPVRCWPVDGAPAPPLRLLRASWKRAYRMPTTQWWAATRRLTRTSAAKELGGTGWRDWLPRPERGRARPPEQQRPVRARGSAAR